MRGLILSMFSAPFAKNLSPITTSLLIQTVKATANPKVLKADRQHLLNLRKTLNLIHKIICYQPEVMKIFFSH